MQLSKKESIAASIIGVGLGAGLILALLYLWTWLIVSVLAAFGVTAPFWPTMGAWVILAALFRSRGGSK